jgi:hypothetical protein
MIKIDTQGRNQCALLNIQVVTISGHSLIGTPKQFVEMVNKEET